MDPRRTQTDVAGAYETVTNASLDEARMFQTVTCQPVGEGDISFDRLARVIDRTLMQLHRRYENG